MGRNHARVYSELAEAELVGIADADHKVLMKAEQDFGVPGFADFRQMLEALQPQAVSVAVPTAMHEAVAQAVLESGANVLVEKPIAATLEQGTRLIDCAEKHRRLLMVGHIVRFNPAMQELKRRLDDGMLGRIFQIDCRRIGPFPSRIQDVGVAVDLAPHDIDIMRYLTGLNPVRVYAEIAQRLHTNHEDLLLGLLRFPDSISGALEINWLTPTKLREVTVLGERGMFKVDDLTQDLYFFENAHDSAIAWSALQTFKGVREGSMIRFAFPRHEPLRAELQAFLQSAGNGTPVPVSGQDSLIALKVALALIEAGQTHVLKELAL